MSSSDSLHGDVRLHAQSRKIWKEDNSRRKILPLSKFVCIDWMSVFQSPSPRSTVDRSRWLYCVVKAGDGYVPPQ